MHCTYSTFSSTRAHFFPPAILPPIPASPHPHLSLYFSYSYSFIFQHSNGRELSTKLTHTVLNGAGDCLDSAQRVHLKFSSAVNTDGRGDSLSMFTVKQPKGADVLLVLGRGERERERERERENCFLLYPNFCHDNYGAMHRHRWD